MPVGEGESPPPGFLRRSFLSGGSSNCDDFQEELACAADALSCVESGDEIALDLIASAVFKTPSSTPESSDSSLSSYGDLGEYPIDRPKLAALSSAFSSGGRSSRTYGGYINANDGPEAQQRGQFLLPLISAAPEDRRFIVKHEGILKALADGSDADGSDLDFAAVENMATLNREDPFGSLLPDNFANYDDIVASIVDDFEKEMADADFPPDAKRADPDEPSPGEERDVFMDIDDVDCDFVTRDCCEDYFLGEIGTCHLNGCHLKWKHILRGLVEYIIGHDLNETEEAEKKDVDSNSRVNRELHVSRLPFDPDVPQMIFDCDSINAKKRFIYEDRTEYLCPGGCANSRPCKRVVDFFPDAGNSNPSESSKDENDYDDREVKYIDIQSAWYEMKVLILWFYWALEQGLEDVSQLAIGFQVPCNCCSCAPINIISRMERLKHLDANSESESSDGKCTCKEKEGLNAKPKMETHHKFKHTIKCSHCRNKGELILGSSAMNDLNDTKLTEYLHILGLYVEDRCCCRQLSISKHSDNALFPVFIASENPWVPAIYVDLLSGFELSETEIKEKVDSSIHSFYNSSREHWMKGDWNKSKEYERYDSAYFSEPYAKCKRCRCSCKAPKFYNFFQVISRITAIIDNFTRISRTYLVHRMDEIFAALCARFNARLIALLDVHCEYTFLLALVKILHIFKKADILMMDLLGPTRARIVSTLFVVLPGKQFLNIIYNWADSPALDIFLRLNAMVINNNLPSKWGDALLHYVNVLPYLQDAEALWGLGKNLTLARSVIDRDDILIRMYQQYYYIGEQCMAKNNFGDHYGFFKQDFVMNKATKQFYNKMTEEIKNKASESSLFSTIDNHHGWGNFEKLVIFAMIRAHATGNFNYNNHLCYQIENILSQCNFNSKERKSDSAASTPLQELIESTAFSNVPQSPFKNKIEKLLSRELSQFFQKRNYSELAQMVYFNLSKHCRDEWLNLPLIYEGSIDLHKSPKQSELNSKHIGYIQESDRSFKYGSFNTNIVNSESNIVNQYKEFLALIDNTTYSVIRPKSILISKIEDCSNKDDWNYIQSSPLHEDEIVIKDLKDVFSYYTLSECELHLDIDMDSNIDSKDFYCNFIKDVSYNDVILRNSNKSEISKMHSLIKLNNKILNPRKWFLITAQILCNSKNNELNIKQCDKTEDVTDFKLYPYFIESFKEPSYKNDPDDYFSQKNKMALERFQGQILEKIIHKISHSNDNNNTDSKKVSRKSLQEIDLSSSMNKLKITSEEISLLEKQDCKGCESNFWRTILPFIFENLFVLDHFESFFSTSEKIEILREHFNIISQIDKSCIFDNLSFKNLDFELLDTSNLWEPNIEEVEDELLKFENRHQTDDEFEQDLHIICFKLVTRNMLEELMSCGDNDGHGKKNSGLKKIQHPQSQRKERRIINGHSVDDYWESIQNQFVSWRSIALKMYLDVVKINKFGFKIDSNKSMLDDECLKKLQKIDLKISEMSSDPIKKIAVKKSFANKLVTGSGQKHLKNIQSDKVQKLAGESWLQAINELKCMKVEGLGKKHGKCDSPTFKSTPTVAKKRNDETREAELLAGMGLGKLLSKSSAQRVATKHDHSEASIPNKTKQISDKTISKSQEVLRSESSDESQNDNVADLFKKYTGCILKKLNKIIDDGPKESQNGQAASEKSRASNKEDHSQLHMETEDSKHSCHANKTCIEEKNQNGTKRKIDPKQTNPTGKSPIEDGEKKPTVAPPKECIAKDKTGHQDEKCIGVCKHEAGKCSLHPEQARSGHQVPNDHPCNCCYCTVFGHAPSTVTPVSRNFNETRERLRTILNKKKQINKNSDGHSSGANKETKKSVAAVSESKLSQEKLNVQKTNCSSTSEKISDKKSKDTESCQVKPKQNPIKTDDIKVRKLSDIDKKPLDVKKVESDNKSKKNPIKNDDAKKPTMQELKKADVKTLVSSEAVKCSISKIQNVQVNPDKKIAKASQCQQERQIKSNAKEPQSERAAIVNKKKSSDANVAKVPAAKSSKSTAQQNIPQPISRESNVATPSPVTALFSNRSRDSSFCTSSVCSGSSENKIGDVYSHDIDSLVKFIEGSSQDTDKEKKQAKKARQKIKKLGEKLLKERDVLHENLISMAGETSRLHEEVVHLKKGLSSAYRKLPITNQEKQGVSSDIQTDLENHERLMLLRRAAQEASARATKAVSLAEHAQSQLRHVESTLNLLSSSVTKVCKQQKGDDWSEEPPKTKVSHCNQQFSYEDSSRNKGNELDYNKSGQNMVTIKRIILPNSDEPGVTITPKLPDQLVYHTNDRASTESEQAGKKGQNKKGSLSWEATIAQINALAHSTKKSKEKNNEKKVAEKNDVNNESSKQNSQSAKKSKESSQPAKSTNASKSSNIVPNVKEDAKKSKKNASPVEIPVFEENVSKNSKKSKKTEPETTNTNRNRDKPSNIVPIINEPVKKASANSANKTKAVTKSKNKFDLDLDSNYNAENINCEDLDTILEYLGEGRKKNKKVKEKVEDNTSNSKSKKAAEKSNGDVKPKKVIESIVQQPQQNVNKGKKPNKPQNVQPPNPTKSQPQLPKSNSNNVNSSSNSQLHIVNNLSSTMDRIRLNDDTTIELASSMKKEVNFDNQESFITNGNKGAPISSSIVEQLKSGVQFADLRLPPGITLTRVDPSKQQHFTSKPNIPLVSSTTPAAYRPTPPAPPPPAVIMVDTTKLHADREAKNQCGFNPAEQKKPGKSKKSRKKFKKAQTTTQYTIGNSHSTSNHHAEEPTKMVTLRNPMFHPTLAPTAVPTLQPSGKRQGDMRVPEPMPMPTNASCQATITPTSNGMYTIRNPLIYQQSMMGINSLETVANPLLLMANQHLSSANPPSYTSSTCDEMPRHIQQEDKKGNPNESVKNLSNKLSDLGLEHKNSELPIETCITKQKDGHFSPFKNVPNNPVERKGFGDSSNINIGAMPTPIKQVSNVMSEPKSNYHESQQLFYEKPPIKPIGTPFSQNFKNDESSARSIEKSTTPQSIDAPVDLPKLYTPFGPTDADKSFGSTAFQPYLGSNHDNENGWSNGHQIDLSNDRDIKKYYANLKAVTRMDDLNCCTSQKPDMCGQPASLSTNHNGNEGINSDSPKSFIKSRSSNPIVNHQHAYDSGRDVSNYSKYWNSTSSMVNPGLDYQGYYNNQLRSGVSSLYQPGSSSSSCIFSGSSSVYDSVSNSSSNSPAEIPNNPVNNHSFENFIHPSEYSYIPLQHHALKSGVQMANPHVTLEQNGHNFGRAPVPNHKESICGMGEYADMNCLEKNDITADAAHIENAWKGCCPPYNNKFNSMTNNVEDNLCDIRGIILRSNPNEPGANRMISNGLKDNEFFADSSSVFAPDQTITNLNDLESSERDIESFKRFDFYFEPPKNKPKISLNVQDIALQRPTPTKLATNRDK